MKVWIKLLIGSALGLLLGVFAPEHQGFTDGLAWFEQLALRVGRYAVIPMLIFSLTIGIYELRREGQFWPLILKNLLLIAVVSALVIFIGVLATLGFTPSRIPILTEEQIEVVNLDISGSVQALFPYNMLSVLTEEGVFLFPICVFAFFFGMGLSHDRNYSKPVLVLVDSLSQAFYHVAAFIIELLGFVMIVLAAYWAVSFREVLRADIFLDLIVLLGVLGAVIGFGVLPALLYFIRPKVNPWAVLYGSLGAAIAGFFSGDINFSLPVLLNQTKENLGVRRRSNALSLMLFTTFCRAGSAMVAAAAFIVIFKSYSSLGISLGEVFSISLHALVISFLLARHPGSGAYTALAVLCMAYGKGFEAGYLILKPLAFYLIAVGTFIDVMIASFAAFATAHLSGLVVKKTDS